MAKKQKSRIQKFINYTKEAFFWPVHLAGLAVLTVATVLGVVLMPILGFGFETTTLLQLATVLAGEAWS